MTTPFCWYRRISPIQTEGFLSRASTIYRQGCFGLRFLFELEENYAKTSD